MIEFDVSEVRALEADLSKAGALAVPVVRAIVQRAAFNIKRDLKADAENSGHYQHFAGSITYDTKDTLSGAEGEIGPDKDRTQGALGNILYFGTSKNGPVLDLNGPLNAETPRFIQALEAAAAKSVLG